MFRAGFSVTGLSPCCALTSLILRTIECARTPSGFSSLTVAGFGPPGPWACAGGVGIASSPPTSAAAAAAGAAIFSTGSGMISSDIGNSSLNFGVGVIPVLSLQCFVGFYFWENLGL